MENRAMYEAQQDLWWEEYLEDYDEAMEEFEEYDQDLDPFGN